MSDLQKKPTEATDPKVPGPETKPFSKDQQRTTVRFSADEYEEIRRASELSGESIPDLLRKSFFRGKKLRLLFDKSDAHVICAELRRIGNNVNQVARRVNSGALEGWYNEFTEVSQKLSEMCRMIGGVYGLR